MKYLVIRLSSLGDVVLTLPGLTSVIAASPGAEFHLLTSTPYADVCRCVPGLTVWTPEKGESLWDCGRRLSAEAFTHVYDLQGGSRGLTLRLALAGPTSSLERYPLRRRWWVWTHTGPTKPLPLRSDEVASLLGVSPQRPCLTLPAEMATWAEEVLPGERSRVALIPGARWVNKRWPPEHFHRLAGTLLSSGWEVVVVGDATELPLLQGAAGDLPVRVCAERDLRRCAAVLARCNVAVGGDSGLIHLAEGVGTPVLMLFGPTRSDVGFAPSLPTSRVLERDLPCRPCHVHGGDRCPRSDHACLAEIYPEEVAKILPRQFEGCVF